MKHALPLIVLLATAPLALAQTPAPESEGRDYGYTPPLADTPPADDGGSVEEGADLIGRGMDLLFRNLLNEVAPEIDNMSRDMGMALSRLGPAISDLSVLVDDIGNYEVPERQENGDIIIRRKPGAPPPPEIGEGLREFTQPLPDGEGGPEAAPVPVDPYQPQIEL